MTNKQHRRLERRLAAMNRAFAIARVEHQRDAIDAARLRSPMEPITTPPFQTSYARRVRVAPVPDLHCQHGKFLGCAKCSVGKRHILTQMFYGVLDAACETMT